MNSIQNTEFMAIKLNGHNDNNCELYRRNRKRTRIKNIHHQKHIDKTMISSSSATTLNYYNCKYLFYSNSCSSSFVNSCSKEKSFHNYHRNNKHQIFLLLLLTLTIMIIFNITAIAVDVDKKVNNNNHHQQQLQEQQIRSSLNSHKNFTTTIKLSDNFSINNNDDDNVDDSGGGGDDDNDTVGIIDNEDDDDDEDDNNDNIIDTELLNKIFIDNNLDQHENSSLQMNLSHHQQQPKQDEILINNQPKKFNKQSSTNLTININDNNNIQEQQQQSSLLNEIIDNENEISSSSSSTTTTTSTIKTVIIDDSDNDIENLISHDKIDHNHSMTTTISTIMVNNNDNNNNIIMNSTANNNIFVSTINDPFDNSGIIDHRINFEFTRSNYNVTIPENSLSKIYATSIEKMGIYISDPALTVRYKIVAGDPDKIFRADHRHVGNFFFLLIRVRHDKNAVLNRENRAKYELRVRATITSEHNKAVRFKSKCNVTVTVLDCNDISPIFFEKNYDIDVYEDVPLETNLIQVTAIDPDIGLNGEIYYSLTDDSIYFAIHPTLGIIYNTRPLYLHQLLSTSENTITTLPSTEFIVNLTVLARDRGHHLSSQTIESSKTKVNIRIQPVNRHAPLISIKQHSTLSLTSTTPESLIVGSSIYAIIHVSDEDLGIYGQICSFNIIDGNQQSLFRVTNQSSNDYNLQLIKSIADLFHLSKSLSMFELVVQARDCGQRITNKTIQISLDEHLSLNLQFTSEKYYKELYENSLIGTQVLQVDLKISYSNGIINNKYQTSKKLSDIRSITDNSIHFSIINGNENDTFGITGNGIIYTRKQLDRENIAEYRLVVRAQHQLNQIATTMIYIDLMDVNDNYPQFKNQDIPSNGIVQLSIEENKPNGSIIYKVDAIDYDSETNNRFITYELLYYGKDPEQLPFAIDQYNGEIFINQPLDFELMHHNYLLFIRASDWGEPFRRQNQIAINVTIVDANDHRPQFEQINCTIYLPIDTKPFTQLLKLSAIDLDRLNENNNENNSIYYRLFTQQLPKEIEHCFRLDEKNGQLELICNLRKEMKLLNNRMNKNNDNNNNNGNNKILWTLTTSATDGHYFSDTNLINIIVVDDTTTTTTKTKAVENNNERKDIRSKRLSTLKKHQHHQQQQQQQRNINVQCTDSGIRHKSQQQYRISATLDSIQLQPEEKEAIKLLKKTNDHGHDDDDENHSPIFIDKWNEIRLREDTVIRTKIATIMANDSYDNGFDSSLIWSLNIQEIENNFDNNNKIYFEIDQFDGSLYLIEQLDYEIIKQLKLNIKVCDQCLNNQKCTNKTITIIVEDVNDNKPIIDDDYIFKISESTKPKTIIGMIYAYDKDSNENSKLEYYIDGHADTFSIDLYNGTLWLDKKLDRETIDKYIIYVTVSDCGQPSLSTTAVITINVLDINDNAPLFFQSSYFLKVREDIPIGTRLMRISAFDQDENESGDIRYKIIDTENNTFAIDELTGNIRLHKALDYEKIQLYNLTIMAMDEGKPPLSTNTYLIIEIEDVNENYYPPKFADFYDTAVVKENMPIGTFVTKVKAIDQDNPNLPLIYQIIGGNGLGRFTIDSNGNIYTSIVLDCEINSNFWLTIVAKDRAAVPLASFLELYIEIEDVNDMPPITKESFYTVNVLENIPIGSLVLQIEAYDQDFRLSKDKSNQILFNISDRQVPFEIDNKGHIRTTDKLDRETISRYVLDLDVMEPTITDSNQYNDDNNQTTTFLKSRTPIIVNILDVNEFEPKSIMNTYRCYMYGKNIDRRLPVCQIIAYDQDDDDRCTLSYEIIEGNEKKFFHLDTNSGRIYSTKDIISKGNYDFVVQISDCNQPEPFTSTVHVIIRVLSVNIRDDNHKPSIEPFDSIIMINRNEDIGYTAAWIKSSDDDNDRLCYYIINGNIDDSFAFLDNGALVVTKSLKNQFINQFNLTLLATDGQDNSTINILVNIMNDYDDVMSFGQEKYVVNVFENITVGSDVIKLNVINDLNDQTSFAIYSTQSPETLTKFEVESWSGLIKIKNRLDYEQGKQHVILVEARSGRKHSRSLHQRTFTKVIINVIDVNDQSPQFITSHFETNVVESSSIGTSILQVQAFDTDYGNNAKINYTIISGNIDQTFDIEPDLGYIYIAKQLNFRQLSEYYLLVKANDQGQPSLSNTANVHILITLPDNSPPKFEQTNYVVDIREDEKVGTVILSIKMVNKQASFFTIIDGDMDKTFAINVNNGELYIRRPLDYEHCSAYQLTIEASNLIGANVTTKVFINIIDINDNAPYWNQTIFDGQIFETTPINTFVQTESGSPLVIHAYDKDSFYNLVYQIVEHEAREYFRIEPRTGAISLIQMLDCDKHQQLQFSVSVIDDGTPKLKSTNDAMVRIRCLPVNDCPPVFVVDKFHATLYLPTFPNVIITKVTAMDCDFNPDKNNGENLKNEQNPDLKYYLKSSPKLNDNVDDELAKFWINSTTGQIMTTKSEIKLGLHEIFVTVSDGKFTAEAKVFINVKLLPISTLKFRQKRFQASIQENSSNLRTILMPNIEGNKLHEHLIYRIMTPTNLFKIARTSGAILYRGIPVDRETTPKFELAIEVQSISIRNRIAQTLIEINVEDINDNQPKFVGLPYQFVFNSDSNIGDMIGKIQAVDMDDGINGKIHYSIISGDPMNLFALNTITGHLTIARQINQNFIDNNNNPINYTLLVMAKDLGKPSMNSMINVTLRMITGGIPLFQQSYYNVTINENYPPMLPFLTIKAESSHGRQIFYQIEAGNDNDEFLLDFNTGTISVVEKLDRETTSQYNLLISATDAISDTSSTVNVYIKVEDINDNQPMFTKFYYNVSIPENLMVGSPVLRVEAYDPDSGANSRLQYHLMGISMNKSHFYISPDEGIIYLKKSLDYELESFYHFEIIVNDYGSVQLTSTAQVWIEILDINDNSPILPATFTTTIDEDIESDGFVTKIIGYDADQSDQDKLRYKIISGSNMAFKIDETTGSIYVKNLKNSRYLYHHHHHNQQHNHHHHNDHITKHHYKLNISLTDGIYSTTETYSIIIRPVNNFSPRFHRILNNVAIGENQPIGTSLLFVNATDNDDNIYGQIEYHILNDYGRKFFNMDQITGEIRLKMELDYEKDDKFYWLILGAQDRGKRIGISALRIALIDQNDNGPRFIVDEYKCSICANVPVDSTILSILALDDDDDPENTVIQYSIYDDVNDLDSTTMMNQINDYVEIASDTGYIYIRKNLTQLIGKRIQFFVKAFNVPGNVRNNIGKNIQKRLISNVVPITIEIVDSCDYHKREAFLYEVFVKENIERGSIVASLNLANYKDVEIEIVGLDQRSDSNKFRIDSDGRIYVNEPLDREIKSKHILALRVYDKIYHITDYFYIIINIMDENDCTPYFDSASYYLSLAENQEIGSTIFKMTALDNDIDLLNNALKYNLRNDHDGTFRIDENSGWISLTKQLDRESIEHYNLQIDITDGLHSNSTSLYIAVYDVNDNKPMIEPVRSIAAIYENSFLGTVILRIKVDDPDMNPELRYYISKGDHLHHFAISSSGDVYVNKTLDRETIDQYSLKILVTDGKYYTESELLIDVLDVNDNGPICVKSKYVEMVSESVPIGTHILTVEAVDQDDAENGKLYFVLDGDHKNHFIVDSFTGRLKTNAKLDREHQSIYLFNVIVYDYQNREWHCTSNVEILLSDINDEPPRFLMQLNSVHVPEDSPVGMILGKVSAIDLDIGPNRQIIYELIESTGEFLIHENSGIIRLAKTLDRESCSFYNLTIMAYDVNMPILNSTTYFTVNVTDINDNAPEFEMQTYKANIDENVVIGTEVIRIFATSKDTGINAEIRYKIINGNVNDTFLIDSKTGSVTVANDLDYEQSNEYFLIIEAKDQGIPPLSSEVNLLINVNDINDMRPQFSQRSYDIVIREDAQIGDKIYQIVASDGDSPPNANLTYSFENDQLSYKEFNIEPLLGILTVAKQLDREMISSYILEIFCSDNGKPIPFSASVFINIEISDYNDNPPLFDKINQTIHLKENRPIGFKFFEFNIYDPDSSLNSGPFKFEFIEGNNDEKFIINDNDCSLRTNTIFNHYPNQSDYKLVIKVTDSGNPPLSTIGWLNILIIQESKTPPKVHPLSITINSLDHFPGGLIGQINATDDDPFDKLTYSLTNSEDNQNIFAIDNNEGFIRALPGLDIGKYQINVTVSDEKFQSWGIIEIEVIAITESMIENAMVIQIYSIKIQDFLNNFLKNFIRSMKALFKVTVNDVIVLSIQQIIPSSSSSSIQRHRRNDGQHLLTSDSISLMFAITTTNNDNNNPVHHHLSRETIRAKLLENKYFVENQIGLTFDVLSQRSQCQDIKCENGECREELYLSENQITYAVSQKFTFVSPYHEFRFGCACHTGFGGIHCNETVNECYRNPCPANKECLPVSSSLGYVCQCPFGKSGIDCNQNAETCQANERDVLVCYQEFNPISFNGRSYVRYLFVKKIDKLSFRFRTQQLRARILTQQNDQSFVILEIVAGYLQYRFNCGEGEGLIRVHNLFVSDGKWHEIIVERKDNTASLLLDRKYRSGGFAPGASNSCLNRLKSDIYFGGDVKSNSDNVVGDEEILYGFNGCLDNILFNGQQIPFHKTSRSAIVILKTLANIEFSCTFKTNTGACRSQPCMNGGQCENLTNGSYVCQCPGHRYRGHHCEIDSLPCSISPCQNDGICVTDLDACENNHSPHCYKCQCRNGFTGINCQLPNHCSANFCHNGGVCEETSIGPKCHCHTGWHGLYCEQDIDECHLNTPACHSTANCINLPGTFRCVCPINSTIKCNGHSLLTTNLIESYFHISYKEMMIVIIILIALVLIAFFIVLCCTCCNRPTKKKPKQEKNNDASESLLNKSPNHRISSYHENCDHQPIITNNNNKDNNFEMTNMTNNIAAATINHHHQIKSSVQNYQELFNNTNNDCNSILNSEDYDQQTPVTIGGGCGSIIDYTQNFKKNAPIASVSPQMIETIKQSSSSMISMNSNNSNSNNKDKKNRKRSKMVNIHSSTGNRETHRKRTSLNDSSDSNVTNSTQTEGYHWDTSDLYLADGNHNQHNHAENFTHVVQYNFDNSNIINGNDNDDDDSLNIPCSPPHPLLNATYVKSKIRNIDQQHNKETSPLLVVTDNPDNSNEKNQQQQQQEDEEKNLLPSPPLEIKLGSKLEFSRNNYIERYLPKHDDNNENQLNYQNHKKYSTSDIIDYDLNVDKMEKLNGNGKQQSLQPQQQQRNRNRNDSSGSIQSSISNQQIKPVTLLTFNRSSLNESADNFSLLTPSSSCSTTPIAALINSSSASDTIDQCSSSMSSSSNNDLKISPLNSSIAFMNGSESSSLNTIIKNNHYHHHHQHHSHQNSNNNNNGNSQTMANIPLNTANGNGNHNYNGTSTKMMTSFSYPNKQFQQQQQQPTINVNGNNNDKETTNGNHIEIKNSSSGMTGNLDINDNNDTNINTINGDDSTKKDVDCNQQQQQRSSSIQYTFV